MRSEMLKLFYQKKKKKSRESHTIKIEFNQVKYYYEDTLNFVIYSYYYINIAGKIDNAKILIKLFISC